MRCGYYLALIAGLLLLSQPYARAQPGLGPTVEILAVGNDASTMTIDFRVTDSSGRDLLTLDEQQVQIVEDDQIAAVEIESLEPHVTSEQSPTLSLKLSDGRPTMLSSTGAAIGVVFDATKTLNADGHDRIAEARTAIERFLLSPPDYANPRTKASGNPEVTSLFIPISDPTQQVQPEEFVLFDKSSNDLINYIRTMAPREGATDLYTAILEAVHDTAESARERRSQALVLVVSDGFGSVNADTFNLIVKEATEKQVKLIAFGIGSDTGLKRGYPQLVKLAIQAGGERLQRPTDKQIDDIFEQTVRATPASLYRVTYRTGLTADGRSHRFAVRVALPGGAEPASPSKAHTLGASQLAPTSAQPTAAVRPTAAPNQQATSQPAGGAPSSGTAGRTRTFNQALLIYFARAGGVATLVALLVILLIGGIRRVTSQRLTDRPTQM